MQRELARILDTAEALEVPLESVMPDGTGGDPFGAIARLPSLDAIESYVRDLVDRILRRLEERVQSQAEIKVRTATEYLHDHFAEPSLSLTEVCAELSVSVSHFSERFKSITGQTFVEYLTELRIERAKEMLRTGDRKSYEIAPAVGFRDPHYFSSTFKKVCGVTPTQYRARISAEDRGDR